jgi:hypothetical protein
VFALVRHPTANEEGGAGAGALLNEPRGPRLVDEQSRFFVDPDTEHPRWARGHRAVGMLTSHEGGEPPHSVAGPEVWIGDDSVERREVERAARERASLDVTLVEPAEPASYAKPPRMAQPALVPPITPPCLPRKIRPPRAPPRHPRTRDRLRWRRRRRRRCGRSGRAQCHMRRRRTRRRRSHVE